MSSFEREPVQIVYDNEMVHDTANAPYPVQVSVDIALAILNCKNLPKIAKFVHAKFQNDPERVLGGD